MTLKAAAIVQSYTENILRGARITSTVAPSTGYDLDDLGFLRPDFRVAFPTITLTIEWELIGNGSPAIPAQGDILVIPFSNLNGGGSPAGTIRLTNDAGLNQTLDPPGALGNGLPKTLVVDLTVATPNAATRTSANWQLVIHDNPENVVLGGAVAIYSPKTFLADRDFRWGYSTWKQGSALDAVNDYQTLFRQNLGTMVRGIDLETIATDADADLLEAWFEGCNGHAQPGLLWFDPDVQDAFLGHWSPQFKRQVLYTDANAIGLTFTELSKGRPLS